MGRQRELETLMAAWERCKHQDAATVVVTGDPGIGKTSLCAELLHRVEAASALYLSASGSQLHAPGFVLQRLLLKLLEDAWGVIRGRAEPAELLSRLCDEGVVEQQWTPIVAEILGAEVEDNEWTRNLSFELRVAKAAEILLGIIESQSPGSRIVILDDMEQADSYSLAVINQFEQSRLPEGMLLLIAGAFGKGTAAGHDSNLLKLTPLADAELDEVLDGVFLDGARERELIGMLKTSSGGNPLHLRQLLGSLSSQGVIAPLSDPNLLEVTRSLTDVELPARLEDLELSRIDALPEQQRNLLKLASVYADDFTISDLSALSQQQDETALSGQLEELLQADILMPVGHGSYRFRRQQSRDALYRCLPLDSRRRMHRRIGEHLKRKELDDSDPRIVYHFSRCDDPATALNYALSGLDAALKRHMLVEAGNYNERCNEIITAIADNQLENQMRYSHFRLSSKFAIQEGDYDSALQITSQFRRYARSKADDREYFDSVIQQARLLWLKSRFERLKRVLEVLGAALPERFRELKADFSAIQAEFCRRQGDFGAAIKLAQEAVKLSEALGDWEKRASACNNLGLALWGAGKLEQASEAFTASLDRAHYSVTKSMEARALNNLSILAEESGNYLRAEELLQQSRAIFIELGDRRNASYCAGNLANIVSYFGKYQESLELFESADRVFLSLGEEHPHYYTVGNIADLKLILGDAGDAAGRYAQVMEFATRVGDKELEAESTIRLGEFEFYYGEPAKAEVLYLQGVKLAEQIGSREFQIRGLIGLSRMAIGAKNADAASGYRRQLDAVAADLNSDRLKFESLFIGGEICRLRSEPQQAIEKFRECYQFGRREHQFELALKSSLRIFENSPQERNWATAETSALLKQFVEDNGETAIEIIRSSRYFRFFRKSIDAVLAASTAGVSLQHIV